MLQQYLTDPAKKPFLHSNSGDRTWYITMNWAVPPFDDIHVRKAANWVMDKAGILQAWGGSTFGEIATHNIPPIVLGGMLPASEYNPYPSEGNQRRRGQGQGGDEAVQVRHQQGRGLRRHRVLQPGHDQPQHPAFSDSEAVVVSSLEKIGIKVKPRQLASSAAYTTIQTVKNKIPIALNAGWGKDYADAYTFVGPLFDSRSIIADRQHQLPAAGHDPRRRPRPSGSRYPQGVTIPSVDADIDACQKIALDQPDQRNQCFADLDKKLMETASPGCPTCGPRTSR